MLTAVNALGHFIVQAPKDLLDRIFLITWAHLGCLILSVKVWNHVLMVNGVLRNHVFPQGNVFLTVTRPFASCISGMHATNADTLPGTLHRLGFCATTRGRLQPLVIQLEVYNSAPCQLIQSSSTSLR
jgi:hypothetical protein